MLSKMPEKQAELFQFIRNGKDLICGGDEAVSQAKNMKKSYRPHRWGVSPLVKMRTKDILPHEKTPIIIKNKEYNNSFLEFINSIIKK